MGKKYYTNICLFSIGVVFIFIIIVELFLRFSTKYGIDCYLARGSNFWEAYSGIHRPSKILGYEPIPNSAPNINSLGLFDREYKLKKEKDTYRIIVFGDSITAHGEYTALLEDKLNSNLGHNFEVWNCGVGGYNIEQYVNYLKYKAIKYNPDLIMIGFCLNDFCRGIPVVYKTDNIRNGLIEYYNPYSEANFLMNRFLFRHSYLYRFLMLTLEKFLIGGVAYGRIAEQENIGNLSLRAIKEITNKKRILLVAIIFPYLKSINEYTDFEKNEYETMIKVLEELEIDYIDLHPYFLNTNIYQLSISPLDQVHPSKEGHKIVADVLYSYLKGRLRL